MNNEVTQIAQEQSTSAIEIIGNTQTIYGIVAFVITACIFLVVLFNFRSKINRTTQKQIDVFVNNGKYIPQIYIELSNSMEYLRFFVKGKKWKKRIVELYNLVFKGYDGKSVLKLLETQNKTKLFRFHNSNKMKNIMSQALEEFENVRTHKTHTYEEIGEASFFLRGLIYHREDAVKQCEVLCDLINTQNLIIVGSAGNGKTNLLCRLSQMLIRTKNPCCLIDARDINENCTNYIKNNLPIGKIAKNHIELFLKILNLLLKIKRKKFFIIIDAINENDREIFSQSIGSLLDDFTSYSQFKFILSCRSEYFDSRYSQYFEDCNSQPYKLLLDEIRYDERAKEKMFSVYSEYYNVHTVLPQYTKDKLLCSLLLMRIFFEINANQEKSNLELRNAEIYKKYIDMVSAKSKGLDLYNIMNKISKKMIESFNFDGVKITDLGLSAKDLDTLKNSLDNNLIISRKLVEGIDITERKYEVIYFVFDELRDFCLSRYLLIDAEENGDLSYKTVLDFVEKLFSAKLSPLEGVLKYTYYYLKKKSNDSVCKLILEKYGASNSYDFYDRRNHMLDKRLFNNMGLSLIFTDFSDLKPYEIEFVSKYIVDNPMTFWRIFSILLQNEFTHNSPGVELAFVLLLDNHSYDEVCKIVHAFFDDKFNPYLYSSIDDKRNVDYLYSFLNKLKEQNGDFSFDLKQFMLLISAIEPDEYQLDEYKEFALNEDVFSILKERVGIPEICIELDNLKKEQTDPPVIKDEISKLLNFLITEGFDKYAD